MNTANPCAHIMKPFILSLLILFAIGLNIGCMMAKSSGEPSISHFTGNRIAVLPVKNMARIYGAHKSVISPIGKRYFMTGDVMETAEEILINGLSSRLKNRSDIAVIPTKQANDAWASVFTESKTNFDEKQRLAAMGRAFQADAVLVGYLYKFRQRVGNRHSVNSPASVAFELYLIDVSNESVLWSGHFNETQQSLSEDLFAFKTFIKRKGRWITAQEMAVDALEEMLKDFPAK